jgi:hypothetical protein
MNGAVVQSNVTDIGYYIKCRYNRNTGTQECCSGHEYLFQFGTWSCVGRGLSVGGFLV